MARPLMQRLRQPSAALWEIFRAKCSVLPRLPSLSAFLDIGYDFPVSDDNEIGLGDMIKDLRRELERSLLPPAHTGLRFELKDIDLELQVQVTRKTSGGGDAKFSFRVLDFVSVEAGGKIDRSSESARSHTFRLKLKPELVGPDGKVDPAHVSDAQRTGGPPPKSEY